MSAQQVTIIGAGPAGLSVAMQLKRYGITPLVLETAHIGGLLRNANLVENYPGFPGGIGGERLVELFRKQACTLEVEITYQCVQELGWSGDAFYLVTDQTIHSSHRVVICSGTKPRKFTEFDIPEGLEANIFYEVTPLLQKKGQQVIIVGAGDAAFDYALNLGKENEVIILNRGQQISCLPLLVQRASANPRIQYRERTAIIGLRRTSRGGLEIECTDPDGGLQLQADYLVGAIGRDPQLDFVKQEVIAASADLEAQGRLYFAGDVKNGLFRQTAIAVGDGILTAMKVYQQLQKP